MLSKSSFFTTILLLLPALASAQTADAVSYTHLTLPTIA